MNVIGAIVAGLVGTVAMSMVIAMAPSMGMPKMDIVGMLGSMFSKEGNTALGWVLHLMMGIVFAIIYAAVWAAGIGSATCSIQSLGAAGAKLATACRLSSGSSTRSIHRQVPVSWPMSRAALSQVASRSNGTTRSCTPPTPSNRVMAVTSRTGSYRVPAVVPGASARSRRLRRASRTPGRVVALEAQPAGAGLLTGVLGRRRATRRRRGLGGAG